MKNIVDIRISYSEIWGGKYTRSLYRIIKDKIEGYDGGTGIGTIEQLEREVENLIELNSKLICFLVTNKILDKENIGLLLNLTKIETMEEVEQ